MRAHHTYITLACAVADSLSGFGIRVKTKVAYSRRAKQRSTMHKAESVDLSYTASSCVNSSSFSFASQWIHRDRAHFLASKKIILSGLVPEFSSVCLAKGGADIGAGMPAPTWSGTTIGLDSSPPG